MSLCFVYLHVLSSAALCSQRHCKYSVNALQKSCRVFGHCRERRQWHFDDIQWGPRDRRVLREHVLIGLPPQKRGHRLDRWVLTLLEDTAGPDTTQGSPPPPPPYPLISVKVKTARLIQTQRRLIRFEKAQGCIWRSNTLNYPGGNVTPNPHLPGPYAHAIKHSKCPDCTL